jgi:shikimate kinase
VTARHVILVGLPGAGKSTVGPLVAATLGRPFLDFDQELERRVGLAVPAQFARDGEPAFRAREAALSAELAAADPMVLAPGGGWMANSAAAAPLRPVGRIIYLRTAPAAALARLGAGVRERPLLAAADDPLAALTALLARRGAVYEAADHALDTDGRTPAEVADSVVALVRGGEGR